MTDKKPKMKWDTDEDNYCFICGKHKTVPCVGGLTGRTLSTKHNTGLAMASVNAKRIPIDPVKVPDE